MAKYKLLHQLKHLKCSVTQFKILYKNLPCKIYVNLHRYTRKIYPVNLPKSHLMCT